MPLEETYLLMEMLVHHIYFELTLKSKRLLKLVCKDLSIISHDWDVSNFVTRLILSNIKNGGKGHLSPSMIIKNLSVIQLSPETRSEILSRAYFVYKNSRPKWANILISSFERQYPSEFELACRKDPVFGDDLAALKSGKSFLLLIDHPDEAIRAKAVKKLILKSSKTTIKKGVSKKKPIKIRKPDRNPTARCLLSKFDDDSNLVVKTLLKQKIKTLLGIFTAGTLLGRYLTVLKNFRDTKLSRIAVKKLCTLAKKRELDRSLENQVRYLILKFIFSLGLSTTLIVLLMNDFKGFSSSYTISISSKTGGSVGCSKDN